MWAYLTEFEIAADLGDDVFRKSEARLVRSPYGLVRVSFGFTRVRHRLKYLLLDDLVEVAVTLAEATEICRRYYPDGGLGRADPLPLNATRAAPSELSPDFVLSVLVSGMFALAARGKVTAELIERWRAAGRQLGLASAVADWFDLAQSLFVTHAINGHDIMYDRSLRRLAPSL